MELVVLKKKAVPMPALEVAHKHGKRMSGGRYPVNAAKEFIELLKQLKANAVVNSVDNPVIVIARADKASMPFRRSGTRGKRAHIYIEVKDKTKLDKIKN